MKNFLLARSVLVYRNSLEISHKSSDMCMLLNMTHNSFRSSNLIDAAGKEKDLPLSASASTLAPDAPTFRKRSSTVKYIAVQAECPQLRISHECVCKMEHATWLWRYSVVRQTEVLEVMIFRGHVRDGVCTIIPNGPQWSNTIVHCEPFQ